jgi:hypothetical protein
MASYHRGVASSEGAELGQAAARRLLKLGSEDIAPGLTPAEIASVERKYGFEFADDHRAFLAAGLPYTARPQVSDGTVYYAWKWPWPDWRNGDPDALKKLLSWPVNGMLFDVEHNGVWHPSWGDRPPDMDVALARARVHLARAPKLVPVYAHRYLPSGRGTFGHPVLSIWQSDIIVYGTDLVDYLQHEFRRDDYAISPEWKPPVLVPFWSDYL